MRTILNVACGSWYPRGQKRLVDSLGGPDRGFDVRTWTDTYPPGSPSHQEVPYGFKPYAFIAAKEAGYRSAIWLDSSCILAKPLPWEQIESTGYFLGLEGWKVGDWCNDQAKDLLGITEEEMAQPLMDGKIIGLDFSNDIAMAFLKEWKAAADVGAFNGSWDDHRHDITCGAVIAHRLGMELTEHPVTIGLEAPHPESYVLAQGMR